MATSKKSVAKASKKDATPKKPVASKNTKAAPVKKQAKPAAKKATSAPKKAVAKKPIAKKAAPATKKVEVAKKNTSSKTKTVTAKKTTPAKKAAAKVVAPKKVAAKKVAPKAPLKKAAPVAKKEALKKVEPKAPVKATKPAKPAKKAKEPAKKVIKTITNPSTPSRPLPSTVSRTVREEKKPNVIVAHRKLENKSKKQEPSKTPANYQPEYRSILDEPQQETGPVYRYSDDELNEFKEIILTRIEAARKELAYLQGLITRKDEAGTEDTENRYMNMEDGSGAMEREQLAQLASRQIQFIGHLEKALMRIENKTYGICRVTGKLIDKARLRAVPHATLSIEAKKTMTK